MDFSRTEIAVPNAQYVQITEDSLIMDLSDGRTISAPIVWYPRLLHGSEQERNNWQFVGGGEGVHWPDLDEDIGVEDLLMGGPSKESRTSLKRWLEGRATSQGLSGSTMN